MSYYNQGPPPPHQQYPQSNSPYPPQGGYPPPPHQGYNQQMNQGYYNQPPPPQWNQGGHPPPQQGWHQGPPPPQQGYGGSPYPPQQAAYGAPPGPPPAQYGAPQGPPPGQYGAPQGGYGAPPGPPQGQYGGGAPGPQAPPSMGYVPGQMDSSPNVTRAADELRRAMKGLGTDEALLIGTLKNLNPVQVAGVKAAFKSKHHRDLETDIRKETSGYFREGLLAICRGPLDQDCHVVHEAIKGLGTKESALDDVLLCRSNADMNAIKQRYRQMYHNSLESDVKGDLSMKTERLFDMVISARRNDESTPVIPQQVDSDVQELYRATEGRAGADQLAVCSIMSSRSSGQIRAIAQSYKQKYHRSLEQVFQKEFSGHMQDALAFIVNRSSDPAKHDADLLEDSMRGAGTKDQALVRRIVLIHWSPDRMHQCKAAYRHFYKRELKQRIEGETSGDYERLMVACLG